MPEKQRNYKKLKKTITGALSVVLAMVIVIFVATREPKEVLPPNLDVTGIAESDGNEGGFEVLDEGEEEPKEKERIYTKDQPVLNLNDEKEYLFPVFKDSKPKAYMKGEVLYVTSETPDSKIITNAWVTNGPYADAEKTLLANMSDYMGQGGGMGNYSLSMGVFRNGMYSRLLKDQTLEKDVEILFATKKLNSSTVLSVRIVLGDGYDKMEADEMIEAYGITMPSWADPFSDAQNV